jgi:DNA-directed RNA polymerase subunit RPC12/RpoP
MGKLDSDPAYSYLKSKKLHNRKRVLGKYGLTVEQYNHMLIAQGNKCAICGSSFEKVRKGVDHNHKTKKVREILCLRCNAGIAMFKEDLFIIKNAILYLEKWSK